MINTVILVVAALHAPAGHRGGGYLTGHADMEACERAKPDKLFRLQVEGFRGITIECRPVVERGS